MTYSRTIREAAVTILTATHSPTAAQHAAEEAMKKELNLPDIANVPPISLTTIKRWAKAESIHIPDTAKSERVRKGHETRAIKKQDRERALQWWRDRLALETTPEDSHMDDLNRKRREIADAREGDLPHPYSSEDEAPENILTHFGVFHSGRDNNPDGCTPEIHRLLPHDE